MSDAEAREFLAPLELPDAFVGTLYLRTEGPGKCQGIRLDNRYVHHSITRLEMASSNL